MSNHPTKMKTPSEANLHASESELRSHLPVSTLSSSTDERVETVCTGFEPATSAVTGRRANQLR